MISEPSAFLSYDTCIAVSKSWYSIKKNKNFQQDFGTLVLKKLLQVDPKAAGLLQGAANKAHKGMTTHVFLLVDMLDCIVEFLGPELDSLAFHLYDLGKKHTLYGVKATELWKMTQSFMFALKTTLGDKFTAHDEESWDKVFVFALATMKQGMMGKE